MRPAFLVDGQMEKMAIQKICPNRPVRILGCNGRSVSAEAIAKRAFTHIELLKNHHYPFIIIADREKRGISANKLAAEIRLALIKMGVKEQLIIGVPDRMIENWIYCDPSVCGVNARECDGEHGAALVSKAVAGYHKTANGPNMLAACNVSHLRKSPSFTAFLQSIAGVDCQWLAR